MERLGVTDKGLTDRTTMQDRDAEATQGETIELSQMTRRIPPPRNNRKRERERRSSAAASKGVEG
jgi:hypothetical protein